MPKLPPRWRRYLYLVSLATIPALVAFGWLDDNRAAAVMGVLNAVFIGGLAAVNVPVPPKE